MAYDGIEPHLDNESGRALQVSEHEHADKLATELQRRDHEHQDVLQARLQQRDHQHQDQSRALLQRREHDHQYALLERTRSDAEPFQTQLALIAIVAAIVLNGGAMLLNPSHATPLEMLPFAAGLVAGFIPTALAWTTIHKDRSPRARRIRHAARLLWLGSIGLFAVGSLIA